MAAVVLAEMPLPQAPSGPSTTTKPPAPSASTPRTLAQPISLASPLVESRSTDNYTFPSASSALRAPLEPDAMMQFFTRMISAHHRREEELERQYNEKLDAVNSRAKEQAEWAKTAEAWSQERAEENRRRKEELLQREHAVLTLERQVRQREAMCIEREKAMMQGIIRHPGGGGGEIGHSFGPGPAPPPVMPGAINDGPPPPHHALIVPVVMPQPLLAPAANITSDSLPTRPSSPSAPKRGRPSKSAKAKAVEAAVKAAQEAADKTLAAGAPSSSVENSPASTSTSSASPVVTTPPKPTAPRGAKRKQPGVTPLRLPPQPAPRPPTRKRSTKLAVNATSSSTAVVVQGASKSVVVEPSVTLTASPQSLPIVTTGEEPLALSLPTLEGEEPNVSAGPPKKKTKRQLIVEAERTERQRRKKGSNKADEGTGEGRENAVAPEGRVEEDERAEKEAPSAPFASSTEIETTLAAPETASQDA